LLPIAAKRIDSSHTLGAEVLDRIDESEYGKFAWVIDPEGNKVGCVEAIED
jgi:predicted enzyme related to lactoylglutathione lyase